MSAVVFMLENKTTALIIPIQPVYFARRDPRPENAADDRVLSVNDMRLTALEARYITFFRKLRLKIVIEKWNF